MAKEKTKKVKDWSNPHKLGFMRWLMIWSVLSIMSSIIVVGMSAKESLPLDRPENIWSFLCTCYQAVFLWLLIGRRDVTRKVVWGFFGVEALYRLADLVLNFTGFGGNFVSFVANILWALIVPVYMLTSRRAKAVLVQPFSIDVRRDALKQDVSFFNPKTWAFWRNLIMYFCVFSVVGHWMEAGYCLFIKWGIIPGIYDPNSGIWRDWLFPFCVYGVGAVACVLLFYPVKLFLQHKIKAPVVPLALSFVWNALICTGIELAMGLMLNQPVNGVYPLWDYSNMFCNFMGQVCLQNACAFGFVATLMTWVIYPALERAIARLSKDTAQTIFIVIVVFFCLLFALYCVQGVMSF